MTTNAGLEACKPVMRATGAFRLTVKAGHLCSAGTVAGINMLESHTEIPTLRIQSEPVAGTPTAFTPSQYLTRSQQSWCPALEAQALQAEARPVWRFWALCGDGVIVLLVCLVLCLSGAVGSLCCLWRVSIN